MIRAIAIDDEPLALSIIQAFCQNINTICLLQTFTSTSEAKRYLQNNPVDLLFLDIQMPGKSGIDFLATVQQKKMVIFTTAFSEYAVDGFNLNAIDYLLKPFTEKRFLQALDKAINYQKYLINASAINQQPEYLLVKADYSLHKLPVDDIVYIEGLDDYIRIVTYSQKPIVARLTLKSVMERLPDAKFERVHRSYIVALKAIRHVRNKIIFLSQKEIAIGGNYEAAFFAKFTKGEV